MTLSLLLLYHLITSLFILAGSHKSEETPAKDVNDVTEQKLSFNFKNQKITSHFRSAIAILY